MLTAGPVHLSEATTWSRTSALRSIHDSLPANKERKASVRLERVGELRNGILSSDGASSQRPSNVEYKGHYEKNGEGGVHMVTQTGKQGMQGGSMTEERKPPSHILGWGHQRDRSEWQAGKVSRRQNKHECKVPHCLLSSSTPQPARKSNTGLLPKLCSMPKRYKSQPNLVILSPLSPKMTLLTRSKEMVQVWRRSWACTSCSKAVEGEGFRTEYEERCQHLPKGPLPALSPLGVLPVLLTQHPFILQLLMVALLLCPAQRRAQGGGLSQPLRT